MLHSRTRVLRALLFSLAASGSAIVVSAAPNIILIISDDHAWFDYGFMRRPGVEPIINTVADANDTNGVGDTGLRVRNLVRTPELDRLADESLVFSRGYSPVSLCRPSLMSIVTGLYPYQHRVVGNDPKPVNVEVDAEYDSRILAVPAIPRSLAEGLGYATFQTGKWWEGHYSNGGFSSGNTMNSTATNARPSQWSGGLPNYAGSFGHSPSGLGRHGDWGLLIGRVDFVTDNPTPVAPINYANSLVPLTDFIDTQVAADRPFFVWYAPELPHDPHDPPDAMTQYYTNLGVDTWTAKYYANIERLDGTIGALRTHLQNKGIEHNTVIIYTADNGWVQDPSIDRYLGYGNNSQSSKSKQSSFDGGLRTPILIHWPQVIHASDPLGQRLYPRVIKTPVSNIDLAATIHAIAGLPPPPDSFGIDLLDLDAVQARTEIFGDCYQHDDNTPAVTTDSVRYRWVVRGGWKLFLRDDRSGPAELYHLYDTSSDSEGVAVDPFETTNLAAVHPQLVTELTDLITAWYGSTPLPLPPAPPRSVSVPALRPWGLCVAAVGLALLAVLDGRHAR